MIEIDSGDGTDLPIIKSFRTENSNVVIDIGSDPSNSDIIRIIESSLLAVSKLDS